MSFKSCNWFVCGVALYTNLAGIISGYFLGSFNGILEMDGFQDTFSDVYSRDRNNIVLYYGNGSYNLISDNGNQTCSSGNGAEADIMIGAVVSVAGVGALIGAALSGWIADRFSRKYALAISGLVTAVGCAMIASSFHFWTLLIGRVIGGVGNGILSMVMSVYQSEMAPKENRGLLVSLNGPMFALGSLIALCTNIGFAEFSLGWRLTLAVLAAIALVHGIGMVAMPFSPRWLEMRKRDAKARVMLAKLNGSTASPEDASPPELMSAKTDYCGQIRILYRLRYRLTLGISLFFFQASSGSVIYYYTSTLFCQVGIEPFIAALAVGLILLTGSIPVPLIVDKVGRKVLLLVNSLLLTLSAISIAVITQVFPSLTEGLAYIIVVLVCIYTLSLSCGWLAIPFVINSEIFPTKIRGVTVALTTSAYFFFTFCAMQVTPLIIGSSIEVFGYFYIIAAINLYAFFFVLFVLPETKGVSLEQMDELFSRTFLQRLKQTFSLQRVLHQDNYTASVVMS